MRLVFDQKMRESDTLFKTEQKAHETIRRLCIENEYVCSPHVLFTLSSPT
jgi:hypothetical protein